MPTLSYIIVVRGRGKGRRDNRGEEATGNFLHLLDESGWGRRGVHARINGAAKQKLVGIS